MTDSQLQAYESPTMSSPIEYLTPSPDVLCLRCHSEQAVLVTRKENFCKKCFVRFIRGKQRKAMQDETYKVKYNRAPKHAEPPNTAETAEPAKTKVLLACSMGMSSLVLVDIIISLLEEQMEMHKGRTGFELIVLNLDEHELHALSDPAKTMSKRLRMHFPQHIQFTFKVLNINSYIVDPELVHRIRLYPDFHATMEALDTTTTLKDILGLCPNKSATEDLLTIVYDELILRTAYTEGCSTVLFGHNTTRIANEIIALTVKGRGSSIFEKVLDRDVEFNQTTIKLVHPLKDVLRAEVEAYASVMGLAQFELHSTRPKLRINRNMTIRDLTSNYFSQLDATGYGSTATTVVKTGEKLGAPKVSSSQTALCQVCGTKIHQNPEAWLRRITVNESAPILTDEEREYVQLYESAQTDAEDTAPGGAAAMNICYGCIVTLSSIKAANGFDWPVRTADHEKQDILNQYILSEDEE